MSSGDDDGGVIADINVTPLVDVTLVLLIIMMVTAPMLSEPTAIKVDLPKGKTGEAAGAPGQQPRTLMVGKGGQIQLDGAMITVEQLKDKLTGEARLKPDLEIGVAADKGAEYGSVIQVLDTIRSAGVSRFSLQMEGEADPSAIGAALGAMPPGGAPAAPGAAPAAPGAAPAAPGSAPTAPGGAPAAAPGGAPAAGDAAAPAGAPAAPAFAPVQAPPTSTDGK